MGEEEKQPAHRSKEVMIRWSGKAWNLFLHFFFLSFFALDRCKLRWELQTKRETKS